MTTASQSLPKFHKTPRNQKIVSASGLSSSRNSEGYTFYSSSDFQKDNAFVQHSIPRVTLRYKWINGSYKRLDDSRNIDFSSFDLPYDYQTGSGDVPFVSSSRLLYPSPPPLYKGLSFNAWQDSLLAVREDTLVATASNNQNNSDFPALPERIRKLNDGDRTHFWRDVGISNSFIYFIDSGDVSTKYVTEGQHGGITHATSSNNLNETEYGDSIRAYNSDYSEYLLTSSYSLGCRFQISQSLPDSNLNKPSASVLFCNGAPTGSSGPFDGDNNHDNHPTFYLALENDATGTFVRCNAHNGSSSFYDSANDKTYITPSTSGSGEFDEVRVEQDIDNSRVDVWFNSTNVFSTSSIIFSSSVDPVDDNVYRMSLNTPVSTTSFIGIYQGILITRKLNRSENAISWVEGKNFTDGASGVSRYKGVKYSDRDRFIFGYRPDTIVIGTDNVYPAFQKDIQEPGSDRAIDHWSDVSTAGAAGIHEPGDIDVGYNTTSGAIDFPGNNIEFQILHDSESRNSSERYGRIFHTSSYSIAAIVDTVNPPSSDSESHPVFTTTNGPGSNSAGLYVGIGHDGSNRFVEANMSDDNGNSIWRTEDSVTAISKSATGMDELVVEQDASDPKVTVKWNDREVFSTSGYDASKEFEPSGTPRVGLDAGGNNNYEGLIKGVAATRVKDDGQNLINWITGSNYN